ncbi:hypothetical protein PLESTB_000025000 [Pleodorina starrii]|uniref:Phosphatidylinositol-specific phospholipase C X domain-containing protein n=1 Tax=Pleodorina starrii TaxID=330485 RepID=A0A9W6BA73_9CHLO|nr:hypothetical protein PLESTB_000025000 [Pleodorina starrii]
MDSWMRDNFDVLAEKRLNDIVLPGTHDSAAYVLAPVDGVNWHNRILSLLARFARPCLRPWTLTQHLCIYRQLSEAGVRFLDVRVAWDSSRNDFMTSHTFACTPLKTVLYAILDFLSENTGEAVVLSVRPDWPHRAQFTPARCSCLLALLSSTCRGYLQPRQPQLPTLGEMTASGRRLLCFVEWLASSPPPPPTAPQQAQPRAPAATPSCTIAAKITTTTTTTTSIDSYPGFADQHPEDIWVGAGCRTLWADSDTPEGTVSGLLDLIAALRRGGDSSDLRGLRDATYWYVSAAVTPTARSMARDCLAHPASVGLRRLASELEGRELPRLLAEGLAGIGAVCLDHPSPAATAAVVRLNLMRPATGSGGPDGGGPVW